MREDEALSTVVAKQEVRAFSWERVSGFFCHPFIVGHRHAIRGGLLSFGVLVSLGCQGRSDAAPKPSDAAAVSAGVVGRQDVPVEIESFGSVEANSSVNIVPQVTGLITEVHFKEGDFVKKGDPLFTIDTRPYSASLAVASAELAKNKALLAQAKSEAERTVKLHQAGIASEQDLARAQTEAESAEATLKVGQAQMRSASINVAFTRIVSPIDGRTGSLLVHAGNVVHVGDSAPLVVVRSLSPVYVRFGVPQEYLGPIRERMDRNEPPAVRVTPQNTEQQPTEGVLSFFENSIDLASGTLSVKATFPNAGLELWPGVSVDVVLQLGIDKQVIVAPAPAIQEGQKGTYAFVIDKESRATLRPVEIARTTKTLAIVRAGLEPGERVVTDGQVRLRNGARVEIKAEPIASEDLGAAKGMEAAAGAGASVP
jgi:multidrug efflux system membrane fusion protein